MSTRLLILPLGMLMAVAVLLAAFHGAARHASGFVEDARGCDWFGYLRQARLFREHGPIGGLDTAIRDDRTRYLVGVGKASGLDPDVWDYGVAPYCHHYKPRVDRVVLQYPPGTGFLHALWPDQGRQARLTFVACGVAILMILLATIVRARAATVPLAAAALGVLCFLGLASFVYDRSIPPSALAALALGWLTVAAAEAAAPQRRWLLMGALGLLLGLSASIRLANILLAAGPLVVFGLILLRDRSGANADAYVALVVMAFAGLAPVLAANAINAGHPLATTYGSIDATAPSIAWPDIAGRLSFYFVEEKAAAAYVIAAVLAIVGVLAARAALHLRGATAAAAMAAINLAVVIVFTLTHEPNGRYYLFPVAVYATAVAAFCLIGSENARAQAHVPEKWEPVFRRGHAPPAPSAPPLRLWRAARLSIAAAALIALAVMLGGLAMPLSPHYAKPDVTVAFDPSGIVWADRNTGNIMHFLDRQAAVFTFLPPEVRERFVAAIARGGVRQYFVVDSTYMEKAVAPFRQLDGFRPVGQTFGHETFVLEPSGLAAASPRVVSGVE